MGSAPSARRGFSPLDRELGLLAGELTPQMQQSVARLGAWMPFERAAEEIKHFTRTTVSKATVRRITEQIGETVLAVHNQETKRIEKEMPASVAGSKLQLMSVDGAMVPLVNKEWTEVKTLAIGTVQEPKLENGKRVVHTTELSYFSRMVEANEFCRQALYEVHRRGREKAGKVCAVTDGAEWEQGFIDYHRSDAVRILDFAHGVGKVADAGRVLYGEATPQFEQWFEGERQALKHDGEEQVLDELRKLKRKAKRKQCEKLQVIEDNLNYLEKRKSMIEYGKFQRKGYPIGSGTVESANKVVVQSRMKQAGMHWARANVNPMLALRNVACNGRWEEAWTEVIEHKQDLAADRFKQRCQKKLPTKAVVEHSTNNNLNLIAKPVAFAIAKDESSEMVSAEKRPYRPAPDHPWRKMRYGRAYKRLSGPKI